MKAAWYKKFGNADEVLNYENYETPVPYPPPFIADIQIFRSTEPQN